MSTQDNINEIAKVIQKAMTAQEAASRGLVPQSGNPDKPGRWIKDPKAEGKSSADSFSPKQLEQLKEEFSSIKSRGSAMCSKAYPKIQANLKRQSPKMLNQIIDADINVLSEMARDELKERAGTSPGQVNTFANDTVDAAISSSLAPNKQQKLASNEKLEATLFEFVDEVVASRFGQLRTDTESYIEDGLSPNEVAAQVLTTDDIKRINRFANELLENE